jgi:hypothetical protein
MTAVKKGDIVKSFDFNGNSSCYMIGEVVSVSELYGDFRAKFIKRIFDNKPEKSTCDFFTAPMQGNMMMDSEDSPRIVIIG